jgi:hypothetical protein
MGLSWVITGILSITEQEIKQENNPLTCIRRLRRANYAKLAAGNPEEN